MPHTPATRPDRRFILAGLAAAGVTAGCAGQPARAPAPSGQPGMYLRLDATGMRVDAPAAEGLVSGWRNRNGLGVVALDPRLTAAAETQARAMAEADRLDHRVLGELAPRLAREGYRASAAGEAIGAGYLTLAEAFSGWRDSRPHNAVMLTREATRMGIGAVHAPGSRYRVYWALILASDPRPQA
jgi:hypothetical protein